MLASSPPPATPPPSAHPTNPSATPACSQKIRSALQSLLALGWLPAFLSPHPAVPSTATSTPPIPPAASYIMSSLVAGSAPSTRHSNPHPTPTPPIPRCNPAPAVERDRSVSPAPPALPPSSFS